MIDGLKHQDGDVIPRRSAFATRQVSADRRAALPTSTSQGERRGPIYVSAKRTQFFSTTKQHLTNRATRCYAMKMWAKYLGSFWKTNPILGGIWWVWRPETGKMKPFAVGGGGRLPRKHRRGVSSDSAFGRSGVRGRATGAQRKEFTTASADGWASRPYRGCGAMGNRRDIWGEFV